MIINKELIKETDGVIEPSFLARLIEKHEEEKERLVRLKRYYLGQHDILTRTKTSKGVANEKIVCNHAKYITDMITSYLTGNDVDYLCEDKYDISAVKDSYKVQDISELDSEIVRDMSIYGRSYELIYADEESNIRSTKVPPEQSFVVCDDTCTHEPLFGVHYHQVYDVDGRVNKCICFVYTAAAEYKYCANSENWRSLQLVLQKEHYFTAVPLIEYRNNADRQGDYEQLIPAIDAYNILTSDRVNDKEQFVDAFLFLAGVEIDGEQAKKLREEKILIGDTDAKAQYLSKVLSESDISILRDNLKEDIHRLSMVPDLSDESFGNNLSGVAIKYKLLGFEQAVKNKEKPFKNGLKRRFQIYCGFLSLKSKMSGVPAECVEFKFTRNLPANNLETAQMISLLENVASAKTLLAQLDFIKDAEAEAETVKEEKAAVTAEKMKRNEEYAQMGY